MDSGNRRHREVHGQFRARNLGCGPASSRSPSPRPDVPLTQVHLPNHVLDAFFSLDPTTSALVQVLDILLLDYDNGLLIVLPGPSLNPFQ